MGFPGGSAGKESACSVGDLVSIPGLAKWIKVLNVRPETIKLLEEKIGRTLEDINRNKILYDPPPRAMEIKTKVNKCRTECSCGEGRWGPHAMY